jgi:hypothetical protein
MSYGFLLFLAAFVGVVYLQSRSHRARPADFEAIDAYAKSKDLKVESVKQTNSYWRYWLRGKIRLSNLSRTFVVTARAADGTEREIHVAFDPWRHSGELQVLQEKSGGGDTASS